MIDTPEEQTREALLATAERAASTLESSVVDKAPDTPIETDVRSLRGLAQVIYSLLRDAAECGGVDCMGRAVDGIKLWVACDRLEQVNARAASYEATLKAIASAVDADGGELDMLVDWQGTARALAQTARNALNGPALIVADAS